MPANKVGGGGGWEQDCRDTLGLIPRLHSTVFGNEALEDPVGLKNVSISDIHERNRYTYTEDTSYMYSLPPPLPLGR